MSRINFPMKRYLKSKTISVDYSAYSLSPVKISTQTIELFLSNEVKIVPYKHQNHSYLIISVHCMYSQYLEKGKKQHGSLIDSESS